MVLFDRGVTHRELLKDRKLLEKLKLVYVSYLSLLCCLVLRSSAGKGADLLAHLSVVFSFCHFPICVSRSDMVRVCVDS